MTSRFFRFLSKRGHKSSPSTTTSAQNIQSSTNSNLKSLNHQSTNANTTTITTSTTKHVKLNVCEDLKESIEHYNQRCLEIQKLKEKQEQQKLNYNNINSNSNNNGGGGGGGFLSFKSFNTKNKNKSSSTLNNNNNNHSLNQSQRQVPKDSIECAIVFLDDTQESFYLPKKSLGSKLYEQVFYHLDLIETDYFGLQFSDTHNVKHWLDPTKPIKKQCKIGPPYQFFFRVKFYTAEPNNLKEELTRYFYFLQLKQDLKSGSLTCSTQEQIWTELCALILQEELGDFDAQNHTIETISEFRFLPDYQQTEEFEEKIYEKYSTSSSYKGMTPAEAELTFLNKAKWLEMYGVDMHSVYGRDQNEYKLGLTPSGILVFEEVPQNQQQINLQSIHHNNQPMVYNKIGLFYWPKIEKVTFSKKKFTILVAEDDNNGFKQEHTFIFNLIDEKACKHLWKCAVEYHAFFRLRTSPRQLMLLNSSNSNGLFNGFIRRGSRFRGPERTEYQTHNLARLTTPRRSVQFERRPSQRFSRRASYAIKRKLQEQQKTKVSQDAESVSNTGTTVSSNSGLPQPKPRNSTQHSTQNALVPSISDTKLNNNVPSTNQGSMISTNSSNSPSTSSISPIAIVNNCCKLQQSTNGAEHDQKCNLYKAQLMNQQQQQHQQQQQQHQYHPLQKQDSVKCSSSASTCSSDSSSSAAISSSSNEKIVDDDELNTDNKHSMSPKLVKNKNLIDDNLLINDNNKLNNKELILLKKQVIGSINSTNVSIMSNSSSIATVPNTNNSDIRLSRPRSSIPASTNITISHMNALNNINATAFTLNNINRLSKQSVQLTNSLSPNSQQNRPPPLINTNSNNNRPQQPITTEL